MRRASQHSLRAARIGVVLIAAALGAVLVVSALASHSGIKRSSDDLLTGQATVLLDSLQTSLREGGRPPTEQSLREWFEENTEVGVTYVRIGGERGISIGVPTQETAAPIALGAPSPIRRIGDLVRAERLRSRRGKVSRFGGRDRDGGRVGRDGGRPVLGELVVEFVPVAANLLIRRARRQVVLSIAIALALLVMAGFSFRWLAKREGHDREHARRSHLAHLGEMSAVLAHEIRNPLASLKGHAELLAESLSNEASRRKAERVVNEAARIEKLTTNLLAFARTGTVHPTDTDPIEIAHKAIERVGSEQVDLQAGTAPRSWRMDPDPVALVLVNLLQNAIEASTPPSRVALTVTECGRGLQFIVRDRGAGIESAHEADLFEPFVTTRTKGTGLGLAVVRRIMEAHGGTITAVNHAEGGAVFTATIPRGPAAGAVS